MRLISDLALATMVIWAEAEGEPYDGKVAVAEVIRHRMARRYSSDGTVVGTIVLRYQFSEWNDDKGDNQRLIRAFQIDTADPVVNDCSRAWGDGASSTLVPNAVLYCAADTNPWPKWATADKFIRQIGRHKFYAA